MSGKGSIPPAELVTLPQAARRAGVGVRQLRRACKAGGLQLYQVGGWPRVRWREVLGWIETCRVSTTPHAERVVAQRLQHEADTAGRAAGR